MQQLLQCSVVVLQRITELNKIIEDATRVASTATSPYREEAYARALLEGIARAIESEAVTFCRLSKELAASEAKVAELEEQVSTLVKREKNTHDAARVVADALFNTLCQVQLLREENATLVQKLAFRERQGVLFS